jgi:hypothetical protein
VLETGGTVLGKPELKMKSMKGRYAGGGNEGIFALEKAHLGRRRRVLAEEGVIEQSKVKVGIS